MRIHRLPSAVALLAGLAVVCSSQARAQSARRSKPATQADIERLEKKLQEQQKLIDRLMMLQEQYLKALNALFDPGVSSSSTARGGRTGKPGESEPEPVPLKTGPAPRKPTKPAGAGIIVGKIAGADDAIVYVDDIVVAPVQGTAELTQRDKQFSPQVLVVTKGTTVRFPNLDAFFHNVFSITPGATFDLGSYPQGQTRTVKMSRPGVVTVYCNLHPQMVGHILVTPNSHYVRAGKDGFFRLTNVPAGSHRVVAWAPNAKPMSARAEVVDGEFVTVELALEKRRTLPHTRKDGLPYGSYEK